MEANGASEFGTHEYGSTRRRLEQSGVGTRLRSVLGDGYDGTRHSNSYGQEENFGDTQGRGGYDNHSHSHGHRGRGASYDDRDQRGVGMDYDHHTPREQNHNHTNTNRLGESRGRSSYDRGGRGSDDLFSRQQDRGSLLPPKPSDSVARFRSGHSNSFNNSSSFDSGR